MPRLIKAEAVDSTNEWVKRHLDKLEDLDSFLANTQNEGKGRNAKDWFSPKGGFWYSFLLKKFPGNTSALSLLTAVVVSETMRKNGVPAEIKWPNDIFLKEKKLGGILIESIKGYFVVGIGLNLNLSVSDFPIPLKDIVITSKDLMKEELDLDAIAEEIIKGIARGRKTLEKVHQKYLNFNRDINRKVRISKGDETFTGTVTEIQPDGGIKVKNDIAEKVFYSGSLSYLN